MTKRDGFRWPLSRVIDVLNPILRGWVNYFAVGHSSRCFSFIRNWVGNRAVRRLLPAILLLGTLAVLARSWGPVPPIGPMLDPYHGIWGVARSARIPPSDRATISSLTDSVVIVYDDRAVPHIFARTSKDARRALGYVAARDRLFQ